MKSQTPLKLAYHHGVEPTPELIEWAKEKGHELIPVTPTFDIYMGPECFNYHGIIEKKQFDLFTKSLRATMRENKRKEKHGNSGN